jgi:hypothetical protein
MSGGNNEHTEITYLREDVTEMKGVVNGMDSKITDIRLFLAGLEANFVTKPECRDCRKTYDDAFKEYDKKMEKHAETGKMDRRWWAAYIITFINAAILISNNISHWFGPKVP